MRIPIFSLKSVLLIFLAISFSPQISFGQWSTSGNSISSGNFLGTTNNQSLIFKINNSQAMVILANGNVGIGTVDPHYTLQVVGNIVDSGTFFANNIECSNSISVGQFKMVNGIVDSIVSTSGTIATTATVKAGSFQSSYFKTDSIQLSQINSNDSMIYFGDPQMAIKINTPPNTFCFCPVPFYALNRKGFAFGGGGTLSFCDVSFGIGTLSPDAGLSIYSCEFTKQFSILGSGGGDVFTIDNSGNTYTAGNVGIATITSSAQLAIKMPASPSIPAFSVINTSGGNVFNVDHSGNVNAAGNILIQTTNNEYALNVGGTIWSNEVQVCMSGCDFVFDKGYNLMSLNELESYLNLNHHLPGIASAKQMETNEGVALGKMDSQLLQKVEELTLYLIQQQKEIEKQKGEINDLKNIVSSLQKNNKN